MSSTSRRFRHVLAASVIPILALACTKSTEITAEAPAPSPKPAAKTEARPVTPPADPPPVEAKKRPPELDDPPGNFTLVAMVRSFGGPRLVDVGDRVLLVDRVPVASAKVGEPLVASKDLARGFPPDEDHATSVHYAVATPKAVWAVFGTIATRGTGSSGVAYKWSDGTWRKTNAYSYDESKDNRALVGLFPWGEGGATAVENIYGYRDDQTVARVTWFDGAKRTSSKRIPFQVYESAASRDGHAYLSGERVGEKGAWIAHVDPSGNVSWEILPGTEGCEDVRMLSGYALDRERVAFVSAMYSEGCEAVGPSRLFLRTASGWRAAESRPPGSTLLAYDARGRLWFSERGSLVVRDADGTTTRQRLPSLRKKSGSAGEYEVVPDPNVYEADGTARVDEGCFEGDQLLVSSKGERFLVRSCTFDDLGYRVVFREGAKPQPVVHLVGEGFDY